MSRPPLKLPKPIDPAAPPKALSSRAWRARPRNVASEPVAPAPASAPPPAPGKPDAAARPARRQRRRAGADRVAPPGAGPAGKPRDDARARPRTREAPRGEDARTKARPPRSAPAAAQPAPRPTSPATPRPAAPAPGQPELPRLSKRMGELGLCSRREADEWIVNGWVRVDGDVVDTLGTRVSPHARIEVDAAARRHQGELVTIILHKPIGYVSGQAEDGHEPASVLITRANHWEADPSKLEFKPGHLRGLAPAGRLDIDSTGLLVFTQDGRVAKHLVGRDSAVEKEYLVRVEGTLDAAGLKLLQHGLELDGVRLKPAKVSWQNEDQLRFVLREGRKRQIRRMCELVGLKVVGLKRVRSGSVPLGSLPLGKWRYLRPDERF